MLTMIKLKAGGIILTGLAAFLVANKTVGTVNQAVIAITEASKWKSYYKCWSKGKTQGEPVAPGYSRTTRPDKAEYEIVDDPSGNDHSHDNQPKEQETRDPSSSIKAVCEAVKAVAEKAIDNLSKKPEAAEGAKEGQTEAFSDDICAETNANDAIDEIFSGNAKNTDEEDEEEKETDQDETVD